MFQVVEEHSDEAVIKVVGVGGGGGNAVEHMVQERIEGVEFIAINTDAQALRNSTADHTLQIGGQITKGLGAGANPEVGRQAAEEDRESIAQAINGSDMLFIAVGMGGGTGTGAAPVVAEVAKDMGILTVAVVTKPFEFEGKKRCNYAEQGIQQLGNHVDSLITIPNDKLLRVLGRGISLLEAFKAANNVLLGAVQGIAELITRTGMINVDFADVRTVMREMGAAMMGTGIATGDKRAEEAAEEAISSPLLEDIDLAGARGILVNITAGYNLTIEEYETVGNAVKEFASEEATVIVGTVLDQDMSEELRVTVVATGIGGHTKNAISTQTEVPQTSIRGSRQPMHSQIQKEETSMASRRPINKTNISTPKEEPATKTSSNKNDLEYLDIPAFLRRQTD